MPASPRRVITPCSMRPLGRPRRRGVEEPDGRDIVSRSDRWPNRAPELGRPKKHDASAVWPASAMDSRLCGLLDTLRTPPAPPHQLAELAVPAMQTGTTHDH